MGTPASSGTTSALTVAKLVVEGRMSASMDAGTSKSEVIALDQSSVSRSINIVREALEGSVRNTPPSLAPLSHQSSHVSIVQRLGDVAWSSTPESSSHFILVAEKYESRTSPVVARTSSPCPPCSSRSQ